MTSPPFVIRSSYLSFLIGGKKIVALASQVNAGKSWGGARSLYVSGKVPTYPSPRPTLTPTSHLGQNVVSGEG